MSEEIPLRQKIEAVYHAAKFRPLLTVGVIGMSLGAAVMEGIGLSFILPIVEYARGADTSNPSGLMGVFVDTYRFLGVPFTLEYIILGVGLVMVLRYTLSFAAAWLRAMLQTYYVRHLRTASFQGALDAQIEYFDREGSDDILNAIITQSKYAGGVINGLVEFIKVGMVSVIYLLIAFYITPFLTMFAVVVLALSTFLIRNAFESGYALGERVADANENIQQAVQAGTQGIRDAKLFGMTTELFSGFRDSMAEYVDVIIATRRNRAGIQHFQQLISALAVFLFIYLGLEVASLTVGGLGVFLFAMFRLSPRASKLNTIYYNLESNLPHLIRSQEFVTELDAQSEPSGESTAPTSVESVVFEDVSFSYDQSEQILSDVSFQAEKNEFIAFVGQSGAGKSTIISLLARMYEPDDGVIRANGHPIDEFDVESWREHVAIVRQDPFIFNDTLRYNITIGNRGASQAEIDRVVEIARVDEFFKQMPQGYETELGDDGVRLSGGQKQRVALARALLKDADVLVLDEATSDLDMNIENQVQRAIESMGRDYITITVAHRLSTVKNADRIYTVADGEIADSGSHKELLERDGKYAELYST